MRLRVTRLSATGGYGGSPFLPESVEFFSRASVTDSDAKQSIDQFVRGCKFLGIWDNLVYVPCLPSMGGLHQLGGSANRTNTPWTIVNGTSIPEGVSITNNNYANYLLTDQVIPTYSAGTPITIGLSASQNQLPEFVVFSGSGHSGNPSFVPVVYAAYLGTNVQVIGTAASGAEPSLHSLWIHGNNVGVMGTNYHEVRNNYRQPQMMAASFNGSTRFDVLVKNRVHEKTHGVAMTGGNAKMRFYPPSSQNGNIHNGWIQGAFLYYGMMSSSPSSSVWQKFETLVSQTIHGRLTTAGLRRLHMSGQSNGVDINFTTHFSKKGTPQAMGPTTLARSGLGGQPINTWVGPFGSNTRAANYAGAFGAASEFLTTRVSGYGRNVEYLIWFQGESDTESLTLANQYRAQLKTLIEYVREDAANPKLVVVAVQIDYEFGYRCTAIQGDFVVSGLTGGLSGANGSYAISALANNTSPYVWTKAGYKIEQQGGLWVFVETTGNTVIATSPTSTGIAHPQIATGWVDAGSGSVSPAFSESRTGNIEIVRKAQRDICSDLPYIYTFDSRGYSRYYDSVHINNNGLDAGAAWKLFCADLGASILTIPIP